MSLRWRSSIGRPLNFLQKTKGGASTSFFCYLGRTNETSIRHYSAQEWRIYRPRILKCHHSVPMFVIGNRAVLTRQSCRSGCHAHGMNHLDGYLTLLMRSVVRMECPSCCNGCKYNNARDDRICSHRILLRVIRQYGCRRPGFYTTYMTIYQHVPVFNLRMNIGRLCFRYDGGKSVHNDHRSDDADA